MGDSETQYQKVQRNGSPDTSHDGGCIRCRDIAAGWLGTQIFMAFIAVAGHPP